MVSFLQPRRFASALLLCLINLLVPLAPAHADQFTNADLKAATAVIRAYIEADSRHDFASAASMLDPKLKHRMFRSIGMSEAGYIRLAEKIMRGATLRLTPDFERAVVVRTKRGRHYLKVPVHTFSNAPLAPANGTATYIAYREDGRWYPFDMLTWIERSYLIAEYPDFRGLKLFR